MTQTQNEKRRYIQRLLGDTVTSAVWTITPSATLNGQIDATASTSIVVSNLSKGQQYLLTCRITGSSGQIFESDPPYVISCNY
jgi:hypothetical protein